MFKKAKIFYIHTISPMHVGSGSDLGIVDMPIQREGHTGFPKIEASSLKGSIREAFEKKEIDILLNTHIIFGYDSTNAPSAVTEAFKDNTEFAGALGFSDARILLFPVKSAKGIFAWVTCPMILKKFKEDINISGISESEMDLISEVTENTITTCSKINIDNTSVILEEYYFEVSKNENTQKIAEFLAQQLSNDEIKEKLIVISDEDFKDFITLSTEVITRIKIDNKTGVVKSGALFTEEYLPSETIMYSLALASPAMAQITQAGDFGDENNVMNFFTNNIPDIIQIGGNATIGKGIVFIRKGV